MTETHDSFPLGIQTIINGLHRDNSNKKKDSLALHTNSVHYGNTHKKKSCGSIHHYDNNSKKKSLSSRGGSVHNGNAQRKKSLSAVVARCGNAWRDNALKNKQTTLIGRPSRCGSVFKISSKDAPRPSLWAEFVKLYKRRYVMMLIFAICSMMNAIPQFQYTVVVDVIACYYHVSIDTVNLTPVLYMAVFLPLVFPVMYLIDKKGLKVTLVLGASMNFIGSVFQCVSFAPNHFTFVLVSAAFFAVGQVLLLSLPPIIAGTWFGATEVGLACAMGVFGNQFGIALGFIVPPLVMSNNCTDVVDIAYEMALEVYPMAAINGIILLLSIFVFEAAPKKFPSVAQAGKEPPDGYLQALKALITNFNFVFLLCAYGLIVGTYFAMSTLLNEMVLIHFPDDEAYVGWLGAIMVIAGMVGSVIFGAFLDRTHRYKSTSLVIFGLSTLCMICYTFAIAYCQHIGIQFSLFTLLGFLMTGYLPVGFDFGVEITYPIPEAMSGSLLNASIQIFSIILTNIASSLLQAYGDFSSNIFFSVTLAIGIIFIAIAKCELKRTSAETEEDIIP